MEFHSFGFFLKKNPFFFFCRSHGIKLLFSWKMVPYNLGKEKLDANIENHVHPELTLESIALSEGIPPSCL